MTRQIILRTGIRIGVPAALATWVAAKLARLSTAHVRGGAQWHSSPGAYGLLAGLRRD